MHIRCTLIIIALCLLSCNNHTRIENTNNKYALHCKELIESGSESIVVNNGEVTIIGNGKKLYIFNKTIHLSLGQQEMIPDRHSQLKLLLISTDGDSAKLNYEITFDHHSFGKPLITIDSGEFLLTKK